MPNKGERNGSIYTANVVGLLKEAGYQPVDLESLPEGVFVFQGGRLRARGFIGLRHYAICEVDDNNCIIGWVSPSRLMNDPRNLTQLAVNNVLGRVRFMNDHPQFRDAYLSRIHNRFTESIDSQRASLV